MAKGRNSRQAKAKKVSPTPTTPKPDVPFCVAWIWWSASPSAGSQPPKKDFDKKIPADIRKEFFELMIRYRDNVDKLTHGLHYEYIGDDIWELKVKRHGNTFRLLFMRWGNRAIALDVFHKTTQKTPKERALQRKAGWLATRGGAPPA